MDEFNQQIQTPSPAPVAPSVAAEPPKRSMKKLFIIIGSAVALVVVGLIAFLMLQSKNGQDVSVEVTAPERVQAGVPFELKVTVTNESSALLKDTQIVVNLPSEFVFAGTGKEVFQNRRLGDLEGGQIKPETFSIIPMTEADIIKQVRVVVSYVPGNLSSRFEKVTTKDVVVGEPGALLDLIPPAQVFGGETFETEVTYRNNSATALKAAELRIFYPNGFTFVSSEPKTSEIGTNVWSLGDIPVGGEGRIKFKGSLMGQSGATFEFKLNLSADVTGGVYTVSEKNATVSLAASPLSLTITANDNPGLIASPSQLLVYKIAYVNNTETALQDVVIKARLDGEMFDLKTLKSSGALDSANTITWNASRSEGLKLLPPGGSGVVEFQVFTKQQYPITRLSSKNFLLKVTGEINSPTVPRGVSATKTSASATLQNKVRGRMTIDTLVFFRDAASGILNSGSLPPRVNQPTQYTIHWKLVNYSTDATSTIVTAYLGPNVRFTNKTKLTNGSLTYNDRTQEVAWTVGTVPATRGVLSPAYEAIFQVELTPAISQLGQSPILIQSTTVSYHDVFTNEDLNASDSEVTTRLPDDPTTKQDETTVKE